MKVGLSLSYLNNSIDGNLYSFLFNKFIRFEPYMFRYNYKSTQWKREKHLNLIVNLNAGESFGIIDRAGNSFTVNTTGTQTPHLSICIEQDVSLFYPSDNDLIEIMERSTTLVAGYLYNEEYVYVQSATSDSVFIDKNIPTHLMETLSKTPYKLGVFGDREYDVKFNPGRSVLIGNTWLMPAWKILLGNHFFKIVNRDKILRFPYAVKIRDLNNFGVLIQLFDKLEDSHLPASMFNQWKWQECIDFDSLISNNP